MKIKGFYSFTAFAGIAILDFKHDIEDKVLFCWVEGSTLDSSAFKKKSWAKIRYDAEGNPFFITHRHKISFSDIMRHNYPALSILRKKVVVNEQVIEQGTNRRFVR